MSRLVRVLDSRYARAVEIALQRPECKDQARFIIEEILSGFRLHLIGGSIRDRIFEDESGNGLYHPVNDLDLIIDDTRRPSQYNIIEERLRAHGIEIGYNSKGNLSVKIDGVHVDFPRFTKWDLLPREGHHTIASVLCNCDLTTSSAGYSFQTKAVYDFRTIESVRKREVDISPFLGLNQRDRHHNGFVRILLYANRFNYKISARAVRFIGQHYTPQLDPTIERFMRERGHEDKVDPFLRSLKRIKEIYEQSFMLVPLSPSTHQPQTYRP